MIFKCVPPVPACQVDGTRENMDDEGNKPAAGEGAYQGQRTSTGVSRLVVVPSPICP